jgi:UDPglucose 6-dehydrogenase
MKLSIIGSGYVGLVTGTCLAEAGHNVICVDNNDGKVQELRAGKIPIYEPGLEELVRRNVQLKRLSFTASTKQAVADSEVIFIAVPTPPQDDGSVDLSFVEGVAREIAESLPSYRIIVDKSTVPVKTGEKVAETIRRYGPKGVEFDVVSNPEFLREGSAVVDLQKPDRIVIGVASERPVAAMRAVYEPFQAPILITDLNSAELIKHAANSFLALKITYINLVAAVCEASHADVTQVAEGMGSDARIGRAFLQAGLGYGGSCFPKDVSAFIRIAEELGVGFGLMREVEKINAAIPERFLKKIRASLWSMKDKKVGQLGLAFKANTDDVRCSVAVEIARRMAEEGAKLRCHDPKGGEKARALLPQSVEIVTQAEEVAEGADVLIVATEWPEYRNLNWNQIKKSMRTPRIFDGRNLFNPVEMRSLGFEYTSMGR